jgi:hypothetical protein
VSEPSGVEKVLLIGITLPEGANLLQSQGSGGDAGPNASLLQKPVEDTQLERPELVADRDWPDEASHDKMMASARAAGVGQEVDDAELLGLRRSCKPSVDLNE